MKPITQQSTINFNGKTYDIQGFAEGYTDGDTDAAIAVLEQLRAKGKIKVLDQDSKEQKIFDRVAKEVELKTKADEFDNEQDEIKDARAAAKRKDRGTYPEVELDYPTKTKMFEHKRNFMTNLRLTEEQFATQVSENGGYVLVIKNITDAELNYIQRLYKLEIGITNVMDTVNTGAQKVTSVVGYTADNILGPSVQVISKAGSSILKTLLKTGVKTTSTILTSAIHGIKEASSEVKNDPDTLRLVRESINIKDSVARGINSFSNNVGGSGIRIKNN